MTWRLPLLGRTVKSIENASQRVPMHSSATEAARQRYQRVRDLARKRLAMADGIAAENEAHQQAS